MGTLVQTFSPPYCHSIPSVLPVGWRQLTGALWTIRTTEETLRVLRTTHSLLRFFFFFDICYLISGIALITMALSSRLDNRGQMVLYGGIFGLFATISALCNFLATQGLRAWRRNLLLPWLIFFLVVIALVTMNMIRDLWSHRVQWRHVFLFFGNLLIFSCWRHMQKQFLLMSFPRPSSSIIDVEAMVREALSSDPEEDQQNKDAPPRYEEVQQEELPPQYDESTMCHPQTLVTVEGGTNCQQEKLAQLLDQQL